MRDIFSFTKIQQESKEFIHNHILLIHKLKKLHETSLESPHQSSANQKKLRV